MNILNPTPTAYELLGIHPSAPLALADAAYWWAAVALQERRAVDRAADVDLYRLTRAFETLADPQRRASYDVAIRYQAEPLVSRRLFEPHQSVVSRIFRRESASLPATSGVFCGKEILTWCPSFMTTSKCSVPGRL